MNRTAATSFGHGPKAGWTLAQAAGILGAMQSSHGPVLLVALGLVSAQISTPAHAGQPAPEPLPRSVDLRPAFQEFHLAPRRQGDRPTCSTFTVVGALEFAAATRQGHGTRLSVEFLNWAANHVGGESEDGSLFSDLWKGFETCGICTEDDMPYQARFNPAQPPSAGAFADAKTRLTLGLRLHWIKEWNVETGLTDEHLMAIQRTLSQGWPVCGGLRWPKQENWVNGVPVFNRFEGAKPNVAKLLQAAGYTTAIIGKWHLGSDPTGFDQWIVLPGQGVYNDPFFLTPAGRLKMDGYTTDAITDLGLEFLQKRPKDKPFFLMLHHKAPHREWTPDPKNRALFKNRVIPEPPTLFDDYATRPTARNSKGSKPNSPA